MKMAVLLALVLVLGHGVAGAGSTWKRFSDPVLGIEFSYPAYRTVAKGCHGSESCVALIGRPMPDSDYLIAFEVFDGDLETVAEERAVFRKRKDGWIAWGRYTAHQVMPLDGTRLAGHQVDRELWHCDRPGDARRRMPVGSAQHRQALRGRRYAGDRRARRP